MQRGFRVLVHGSAFCVLLVTDEMGGSMSFLEHRVLIDQAVQRTNLTACEEVPLHHDWASHSTTGALLYALSNTLCSLYELDLRGPSVCFGQQK